MSRQDREARALAQRLRQGGAPDAHRRPELPSQDHIMATVFGTEHEEAPSAELLKTLREADIVVLEGQVLSDTPNPNGTVQTENHFVNVARRDGKRFMPNESRRTSRPWQYGIMEALLETGKQVLTPDPDKIDGHPRGHFFMYHSALIGPKMHQELQFDEPPTLEHMLEEFELSMYRAALEDNHREELIAQNIANDLEKTVAAVKIHPGNAKRREMRMAFIFGNAHVEGLLEALRKTLPKAKKVKAKFDFDEDHDSTIHMSLDYAGIALQQMKRQIREGSVRLDETQEQPRVEGFDQEAVLKALFVNIVHAHIIGLGEQAKQALQKKSENISDALNQVTDSFSVQEMKSILKARPFRQVMTDALSIRLSLF